MHSFLKDLQHGISLALKKPLVATLTVIMLALGIAANTTVFSWIYSILLNPIPGVSNAKNLVSFETVTPDGQYITTSYEDFRDYRDNDRLLSGIAVSRVTPLILGDEDNSERVWGELASGNYFSVLGVKMYLGRTFLANESGDTIGASPVVVIGYALWKRRFHGDPQIIGTKVRVNRQLLTIVGVAPANFHGIIPGLNFDMWIPAVMGPRLNVFADWWLSERKARDMVGIARLAPGVSIAQAQAELKTLATRLAAIYPNSNEGVGSTVMSVWKGHFGVQGMLLRPLQVLMGACLLVLLIVCANVGNLLLAQAMGRRREFGIRVAMGAPRWRLVAQSLTEGLSLSLIGSLFGILLTLYMDRLLRFFLPANELPFSLTINLNSIIIGFAVLIGGFSCVISGAIPAMQVARSNLNDVLKEEGRSGTTNVKVRRLRSLVIIFEVAMALVALISAGLFLRSFQIAQHMDTGFDPRHVVVSRLYVSGANYSVSQVKQLCQRLSNTLVSEPGIVGAAIADTIPLGFGGGSWEDLNVQGYVPTRSENMKILRNAVTPGYLDVLKIPLLNGRDFRDSDDETADRVMIVSEAFARKYLRGQDPIGYRVKGWNAWFRIIGVAKDSKYERPNEAPRPYVYVPLGQVYRLDFHLVLLVRTSSDPRQMLEVVRRQIQSMDPQIGVFDSMPMVEYIAAAVYPQKVSAMLLGMLSGISVILVVIGLYGVMAYSTMQREQEIAIRVAVGANPNDIFGLVLYQGMKITAVGLIAGIGAAFALTRLAEGLLIGVSPTDPLVCVGAIVFLASAAIVAIYFPARRAARMDPIQGLRPLPISEHK